jgi:hypothetical protein
VPHPVIDWHVVGVDEDGDPYTVANPFPVSISGSVSVGTVDAEPVTKSLTDRSGSITLGGTAQQIAAANASRTYFFFENTSDEEMRLRWDGGTASSTRGMRVPPYGNRETGTVAPSHAVSVYAATTGKTFEANEAS